MLDPKDWLLLFLSEDVIGVKGELDPVRIQKGMFLLSKRGPARELYQFRPYNWGPYSSDVNRHLYELESQGLVASTPVPGQTWSRYTVTRRGEEAAAAVAQALDETDLAWLAKAKRFVKQHSFTALLRKIYKHYPEYATKSLLR